MTKVNVWIRNVWRYHALSEPDAIWPETERIGYSLHSFEINDIGIKPQVSWKIQTHCPKCWKRFRGSSFIKTDVKHHIWKTCPADDGRWEVCKE